MTGPDGLHVYADSHDVQEENQDETFATLRLCGATKVLPCAEGVSGHFALDANLVAFCERAERADIVVEPFFFPDLMGDMDRSRAHYLHVRKLLGRPGQLDAEPRQIGLGLMHWTHTLVESWLRLDEEMGVTTTRVEAPHLGPHDRVCYAQLEAQTSFDSLDRALEIFGRTSKLEDVVLVAGAFNEKDDPRTLDEIREDWTRAEPHMRLVGRHCVWSAHTITKAKADLLRDLTLRTFGVRP